MLLLNWRNSCSVVLFLADPVLWVNFMWCIFSRTNFLQFISRNSSCSAKSSWHFFGSSYEYANEKLTDCQEHSLGNDVSNFSLFFIFCLSSFPFQDYIFPAQQNCCMELSTYNTILESWRTQTREEQSNYLLEWRPGATKIQEQTYS